MGNLRVTSIGKPIGTNECTNCLPMEGVCSMYFHKLYCDIHGHFHQGFHALVLCMLLHAGLPSFLRQIPTPRFYLAACRKKSEHMFGIRLAGTWIVLG